MSQTWECSRRTFLQAGAATALSAGSSRALGTATASPSEPTVSEARTQRFDEVGSPSREAERAWAEREYQHHKRMREEDAQQSGPGGNSTGTGLGSPTSPSFARVLDAVEDVGCDPTGNRPISADLDSSAMQDGTLIVFPPGRYLLTSKFQASVDGTFGMVGQGYEQASSPPKPGSNTTTFVTPSQSRTRINFRAKTGLFANVVMDQRSSHSSTGIVVESSGFVQARDVRFVGVQDNTGAGVPDRLQIPLCALQSDEGATARAERVVGRYIGLPGDKNSGGAPFFWVGSGNSGTAQMGHCIARGAADNGLYGARTPGNAQVKGGKFINNEVSQLRYSGRGSWADGVTLIVDKSRYKGPTANGGFNEKYGTNGVKIERGDSRYAKPGGAVLRNADLRVLSVGSQGIGAPVFVRGSGGAVKIENCRLITHLAQPTVIAQAPGEGYSGATAPPPHNITITDSLFAGTNAEIEVRERENSLIRQTCLKVPGAGPDSISGMRIGSGVGFGKQCKSGGLKNPKKVGSSGNLSSVPMNVSYNGSASTGASTTSGSGGGGLGWAGKLLGGMVAAPLVGFAVMAFPLIIGLLVLGSVTFGGLFLFFKKLAG